MTSRAAAFIWLVLLAAAGGLAACATSVRQDGQRAGPASDPQTADVVATHRVRDGDTLSAIARRHGTTVRELAATNGLTDPNRVKVGQVLRIPRPAMSGSSKPPVPSGIERVVLPAPGIADAAGWTDRAAFAWPVQGRIVSDFGARPDGKRNDGINIAARRDTPVRAAAAGEVVYAGNELRGFGNLVVLRHGDGFSTVYGHNARNLVRKGEWVDKGQVIAEVGDTGGVATPQLHFEVRRGATPLDPRAYLLTQTTAR